MKIFLTELLSNFQESKLKFFVQLGIRTISKAFSKFMSPRLTNAILFSLIKEIGKVIKKLGIQIFFEAFIKSCLDLIVLRKLKQWTFKTKKIAIIL